MGSHNLLKLVLGTLVIIAVTAGGGCEFISGGADSLATTAIPTTLPSTTTSIQIRPFPTEATGIIDATPFDISMWLALSSRQFHFIDVRTPEEYASGHISYSVNIDISAPDFAQNIDNLDKAAYYIVYCRTGVRSTQASEIMLEHSFTHIVNMTGGITAWIDADLDNIDKN
jgi:phage shock protein E